jgi:cellulose synthase/poly-beta-1,6-N-acetylglucosamine synthase-like glycosyltransferase
MNKPLVSVVMVICNVDRFLRESIESILGQTFRDFEFIIVDFGSTDNSRTIASSYAEKDRRVQVHEIPNCGLAEARNAGAFLAQGRYIAVMDADDISLPNRLQSEVDFMEKHSEVSILGGATQWIDEAGNSLGIHRFSNHDHELNSPSTLAFPFCHPTVLIRKQAFMQVGGYRTGFTFGEDYDLWLRLAEHFRGANLEQVVLKYRNHPYQVQSRKSRQQSLCLLAAQVSAGCRRDGKPDPFDSIKEITPSVLASLGVSEAMQQIAVTRDWIRAMYEACQYSSALEAALDALQSPEWKSAERWQTADTRLLAARVYWKQKRFARGLLTAGHAFMTRPIMIGRPLKPLLRWFRFRKASTRAPQPGRGVA